MSNCETWHSPVIIVGSKYGMNPNPMEHRIPEV